MNFNCQVRQWFAGLERSDLSATSSDLSGMAGETRRPDKSDLYKEITNFDW